MIAKHRFQEAIDALRAWANRMPHDYDDGGPGPIAVLQCADFLAAQPAESERLVLAETITGPLVAEVRDVSPQPDPEQAARERLGRWLAAAAGCYRQQFESADVDPGVGYDENPGEYADECGATLAEAINAALDAAQAGSK